MWAKLGQVMELGWANSLTTSCPFLRYVLGCLLVPSSCDDYEEGPSQNMGNGHRDSSTQGNVNAQKHFRQVQHLRLP